MFEEQGENEKWTKSYESCDVTPTPLKDKPLILLPNREIVRHHLEPLQCFYIQCLTNNKKLLDKQRSRKI